MRDRIGTAWDTATSRSVGAGCDVLDVGIIDAAPRAMTSRERSVGCLGRLLFAAIFFVTVVVSPVRAAPLDQGVWLIDGRVAVQIFHCDDLLCGRIVWLQASEEPGERVVRDKYNPDPRLRRRNLCGLTIFWNLQATPQNSWGDGWFYNPDDGTTYRVAAKLSASDVLVARVYLGVALFGPNC